MAIRKDNQLLDGTYGTTNPITANNTITAERHRDIIESKVSRYSFQHPDASTEEGKFITSNETKQNQQDSLISSLSTADNSLKQSISSLETASSESDVYLEEKFGDYLTESSFDSYQMQQSELDIGQNQALNELENTVVKSVNTILPDEEGNVNVGLAAQNSTHSKFLDCWSQAEGTELKINLEEMEFIYKKVGSTYLPYVKNLTNTTMNLWFRTVQLYDGAGIAGTANSTAIIVAPGATSSSLDNDSAGLGFGSFPNNNIVDIIDNDTGKYYKWRSMASGRGNKTTGGVIASTVECYQ